MKMFFRLKLAGPIGILAKAFEGVQTQGALDICKFYKHYSSEARV